MIKTNNLPGFILAGGQSRRLGEDKARAILSPGLTLIEAVLLSLRDAPVVWTAVADEPDKFQDLGLPTIVDSTYKGPLGGIERAGVEVGDGYFFIASCDRVGLQSAWIDLLREQLTEDPPAVVFRADGRWEPLFGFYHTRLLPVIRRRLTTGERSVWRLLEDIGATALDAPQGWNETISVNTAADLEAARRSLRSIKNDLGS